MLDLVDTDVKIYESIKARAEEPYGTRKDFFSPTRVPVL